MARKGLDIFQKRECEYFFNERSKVQTVSQPLIDRGLLNERTIFKDLQRERRSPLPRLAEDMNYNYYVRKTILTWLTHVVGHCRISIDTYALSIRIFDKAMESLRQTCKQNSFQLIAATCLIMSSKLLDTITLPVHRVIEFADNTFTENQIYMSEKLILGSLRDSSHNLDVFGVTPVDMIAPLAYVKSEREVFERVRSNAYLFYAILAPTRVFHSVLPSLVAGSLVFRGHCGFTSSLRLMRLREEIIDMIQTTRDAFDSLVEEVEKRYLKWINENESASELSASLVYLPSFKLISTEGTPTDVVSTSSVMDLLR